MPAHKSHYGNCKTRFWELGTRDVHTGEATDQQRDVCQIYYYHVFVILKLVFRSSVNCFALLGDVSLSHALSPYVLMLVPLSYFNLLYLSYPEN